MYLPPKRIQLILTESEMKWVYGVAEEREKYRDYSNRRDPWGQGNKPPLFVPGIGILSQAVRPIFAGTLAEHGFVTFVSRFFSGVPGIDTSLLENGDGGFDHNIFGFKVQTKARQNSVPRNRVKIEGKPIAARAVVFVEWDEKEHISLLGWLYSHEVVTFPIEPGKNNAWQNHIIHDRDLHSMDRLITEIAIFKEFQSFYGGLEF